MVLNDIVSHRDAVLYYSKRLNSDGGAIKSVHPYLNDILTSPSIISIVARPQWGKTFLKDQICEELYYANRNNKDKNTTITGWLDFQLELTLEEKMKRWLMLNKVNIKDVRQVETFLKAHQSLPFYTVMQVRSIDHLVSISLQMLQEKNINLISIDHALIITKAGKEMHDLYSRLVELKKAGIYVIVLSQLSRAVTDATRCKNKSSSNRIFESDIYNSDALMQYSDMVIYIDRPTLRGIELYCPAAISVMDNESIIGLLKNRYGELKHYKYTIDSSRRFINPTEIELNFKRTTNDEEEKKDNSYEEDEIIGDPNFEDF